MAADQGNAAAQFAWATCTGKDEVQFRATRRQRGGIGWQLIKVLHKRSAIWKSYACKAWARLKVTRNHRRVPDCQVLKVVHQTANVPTVAS